MVMKAYKGWRVKNDHADTVYASKRQAAVRARFLKLEQIAKEGEVEIEFWQGKRSAIQVSETIR